MPPCRVSERDCAKLNCKRREVMHLRGLLKLLQTHPEMVDLDDCRAAGFLLE